MNTQDLGYALLIFDRKLLLTVLGIAAAGAAFGAAVMLLLGQAAVF